MAVRAVHSPQNTPPQSRQWCRLTVREKLRKQPSQADASWSGFQWPAHCGMMFVPNTRPMPNQGWLHGIQEKLEDDSSEINDSVEDASGGTHAAMNGTTGRTVPSYLANRRWCSILRRRLFFSH